MYNLHKLVLIVFDEWSLLLTSDWSSLLIIWLVCPQIWDMTQVVGSSVAAGFSPRWLAVSEGPSHTPPTDICWGSWKHSPTCLTLSSFSCGVYAKQTVQQGVCEYMCVLLGWSLIYESAAFMSLMRYDGLDLSEHELKVLLKAQYLRSFCVCVLLSISTIQKNRKHFLHPTSCLFIHLSCLSFFHFLNLSATTICINSNTNLLSPPKKCHWNPIRLKLRDKRVQVR